MLELNLRKKSPESKSAVLLGGGAPFLNKLMLIRCQKTVTGQNQLILNPRQPSLASLMNTLRMPTIRSAFSMLRGNPATLVAWSFEEFSSDQLRLVSLCPQYIWH